MAMVTQIRILSLWACECDLLTQEVILAHFLTPGCCFDNLVSLAPNNVRQYISDMSVCKQHADPKGCVPCCGKAMTCLWQPGASRTAKSAV